jgi:hypothetical protein
MSSKRCQGKTAAGAPCRAPATAGGLCFFHANPEKARALGQVGGRKNRYQLPDSTPRGPLSAADLRDILGEAIRDVRSKKITPRTAGALSQLCNSLHRILPATDLEARLARLEQQLAEQESRMPADTDPTRSFTTQDETGGRTDARSGDADTVEMESGNGADGRSDGSGEAGSS